MTVKLRRRFGVECGICGCLALDERAARAERVRRVLEATGRRRRGTCGWCRDRLVQLGAADPAQMEIRSARLGPPRARPISKRTRASSRKPDHTQTEIAW